MAKNNISSVVGYTVVGLLLLGGVLILTGVIQIPGMTPKNEGFEEHARDEEEAAGPTEEAAEGFEDEAAEEEEPAEEEEETTETFVGGYSGSKSEFAAAGGASGRDTVPSTDHANCYTRDGLNPTDLLPKASPEATQFLASNPPSAGSPEGRNLLQAGYHIGVDTVCQSNKNPNLQLRSDPPISRAGPQPVFNASTIPFVQNNRRVLEVGSQLNPEGCADFKTGKSVPAAL